MSAAAAPLFEIKNFKRFYGIGDKRKTILDIESLSLPRGRTIAIMGPSGSGKSSLINTLGGLESGKAGGHATTVGEVLVNVSGNERGHYDVLKGLRPGDRHRISYVFQDGHLLKQATVRTNLVLPRVAVGLGNGSQHLAAMLDVVELKEKLDERVLHLSGGERQRVGVVRALARDPAIVFADEPASSLDPVLRERIISILTDWQRTKEGRSLIWVTHDYEAAERADDWLVLRPLKNAAFEAVWMPNKKEATASRALQPSPERDAEPDRGRPRAWQAVYACDGDGKGAHIKSETSWPEEPRNKRDGFLAFAATAASTLVTGCRLLSSNLLDTPKSHFKLFPILNVFFGFLSKIPLISTMLRFNRLPLLLIMFGSLTLITLITLGSVSVDRYFDRQISDPSLRHVIIDSVTGRDDTALTPSNLKALSQDLPGSTSDDGSLRAFGRITSVTERATVGPTSSVHDLLALRIDTEEPLVSTLSATTLDGAPIDDLASLLSRPKRPFAIVLSETYAESLATKNGVDKAELFRDGIVLERNHSSTRFDVVGLVKELPSDRIYRFDALMSLNHHLIWTSEVNPDSLGRGDVKQYERAAIYFDRNNHDEILNFLDKRSFNFQRDLFEKFSALITTAERIISVFKIATFMSVALTITLVVLVFTAQIDRQAKPLAVLRAHGGGVPAMVFALSAEAFIVWALAAGLITFAYWSLSQNLGFHQYFDPSESDPWSFVPSVTLPILIVLAGSIVAPAIGYALWLSSNRDIASTLKAEG